MKTGIFLNIQEDKCEVKIEGSGFEIIARLCALFNHHPEVKSLFAEALRIEAKHKDEVKKESEATDKSN